jgi:hypothetical protein
VPHGAPVVTQVSRWDRLKDPLGVMEGFAMHAGTIPDAGPRPGRPGPGGAPGRRRPRARVREAYLGPRHLAQWFEVVRRIARPGRAGGAVATVWATTDDSAVGSP